MELPGLIGEPQRPGDCEGHHAGMGDRGEVDIPDAIGELVCHLAGDFDRQAGLSGAARAGQRDKSVVSQEVANLGHLRMAADKGRQLRRKMMSDSGIRRP